MNDDMLRTQGFDAVKTRLEEIAEAVGNDEVPLDTALDLFEEAVALGMQVSDLLEEGVLSEGSQESDSEPGQEQARADAAPKTAN